MLIPSSCQKLIALLAAAALFSACGGGGSPAGSTVDVRLTDMPVDDADEVVISIRGVAFKPEGSAPEIVEDFTPRSIDLLQYQNGQTTILLDDMPMDAGRYQWLRLIVDTEPNVRDSYIVLDGQECELNVPSGTESGLKMHRPIEVPVAGSLALTVDFDLRKSIHAPPGLASDACTTGYQLRPTLRLVNDASVGAIDGTVSFESGTVPLDCKPKVYLYEGSVSPDDEETETAVLPDVDAYSVIGVDLPEGSVTGTYRAAFIPAGDYTAAFTCDDDTDADETLGFAPPEGAPVTVSNNVITTIDFVVPSAP